MTSTSTRNVITWLIKEILADSITEHIVKTMNEQSAKCTEILIWKRFLLMKMYDAWTFVVKLRIRHVHLFYQYA